MLNTVRNVVVLSAYDEAAQAVFGRFTTPPTEARKRQINALIVALKAAGIWLKLDALYVMAAADAQAALLNWVASQYDLTAVNSPTFAADQGFTGNGTSARLASTFDPTTAPGPKFVLNSGTIGIFNRTNNNTNSSLDLSMGSTRISRNSASTQYQTRVQDGTATTAPAPSAGHWAARRIASNERTYWKDGVVSNTDAVATTSITSGVLTLLSAGASAFSTAQLSLAYVGGGFDDTQMVAMNAAIAAYKTSVGF